MIEISSGFGATAYCTESKYVQVRKVIKISSNYWTTVLVHREIYKTEVKLMDYR